MGLQMTQLSGIIRYELLMYWRRRSLPVLIGFAIVALIGFTLLAGNSFGTTTPTVRVERDRTDPSVLLVTQRNADGTFTTHRLERDESTTIPEWLIGVDLLALTISLQVIVIVAFATQALLVALLPLLSEVIPLDKQYKVRPLLDALPLGRTTYLGGKLLGAWIGILIGLVIVAVVFGIYSYVRYGAFNPAIYAQVWIFVVIPSALIVSGWAILINAFMGSRRGAVLLGLALIPLVIAIYLNIVATIYQSVLRMPQQATNGHANYQALIDGIFSEIVRSMGIQGFIFLGVALIIWLLARRREAYGA